MPTNHNNPGRTPGWFGLAPEVEAEARGLIDISLNGQITPEQHQRLEQMVIGSDAVARLYLEVVHLWYIIPLHVTRAALDLNAAENETRSPSDDPMDQTMILPALHETDLQDHDFELIPPPGPTNFPFRRIRRVDRRWWWRSAAAVLALGVTTLLIMKFQHPVSPGSPVPVEIRADAAKPAAVVTATAATGSGQPVSVMLGTELADGDIFQIDAGAAELTFSNGTVAVVEGPARLRIVNRNAIGLETGALTAHVPPAAHGFHVISPGVSVVDLGTDFGVRALAGGHASEVQVFGGRVDVGGIDSAGKSTAPVIHLIEGQAVRHEAAGPAVPVPVAYTPAGFIRDIASIRTSLPVHGTGEHLRLGGPDSNWQLITVAGNPGWQPRAAVVMTGASEQYTKFVPANSWVGVNREFDTQPVGDFVFRTTVDLSDFDPATVEITANVAADDFVGDIRVNGVSAGVSTEKKQNRDAFEITGLPLPASLWHKGMNQVDVVVTNRFQTFTPNCMAFHLNWTATGTAAVHR